MKRVCTVRQGIRRPSIGAIHSFALLALLLWLPLSVQAHDATFPIGGDSVSIETVGDPSTWTFNFSTTGQGALDLLHDPQLDATTLLVRGLGPNAGRTSLIRLDQGKWSADPGTGGYQYTDLTGAQGGVESVALAPGSLSIFAEGANWPWDVTGGQDQVWVEFALGEELFCAEFDALNATATVSANTAGSFAATAAPAPPACQEPVCGNGIHELGEECDDGDFDNGDGCTDQCVTAPCDQVAYASTWEAIQSVVIGQTALEGYNCLFCHDPLNPAPPLFTETPPDLRPGFAYQSLVNVPSANLANHEDYVEPGEPIASFLYRKLEARTEGIALPVGEGFGMPAGAVPALTHDHLHAVEKWIRGGAPETGVVEGTAEALGTCLPPPTPLKIPPPPPPPVGTGVQLVQTPWDLPAQSEDEICMATYYDFTGTNLVPEEYQVDCPGAFGANNPSNKCFLYHERTLLQDPQSHHSIIHIYTGAYDINYVDTPAQGQPIRQFGPFTYKGGESAGLACDPAVVDPATGSHPGCSGPVVSDVACLTFNAFGVSVAFGPPDYNNAVTAPTFAGSQEPYDETIFAPGVYAVLPMAGAVVWNSHAFNLTTQDSTMDQYLNLGLAGPSDRLYPVRGIFDSESIFSEDVLPYQTQEVCRTYLIEQGARLFNLNSHTHRHGVRFRIWEPPHRPCYPDQFGNGCSPPADNSQLIYVSTEYTDPVQLNFEPPVLYESANPSPDPDAPENDDRRFLYCSLYDNGSTPSSPAIKQQSTSPAAPVNFDILIPFQGGDGGPCGNDRVACLGGSNAGALCGGDDGLCPGGTCDACPVRGGVTTEDEMLIMIGSYYIPEPAQAIMALAALLTVAGLRRRAKG